MMSTQYYHTPFTRWRFSPLTRWLFLLITCHYRFVAAQDCAGTTWGDPTARTEDVTTNTHVSFLAVAPAAYVIGCDGRIDRWQYYTSGSCHDVTFQVWRPVDVTISEYQLVGENILSEMAPAEIVTPPPICVLRGTQSTVAVQEAMRLPVQPGDIIGWNEQGMLWTGRRRFSYETGLTGSNAHAQVHILDNTHTCGMTVGGTCDWGNPPAELTTRSYSLEARMNPAPQPVVSNPKPLGATTVMMDENQPIGTYVFTAHAHNNHNWNDVVTRPLVYSLGAITPDDAITGVTDPFVIDSDTGVITTGNILDYDGSNWLGVPPDPLPGDPQVYTIPVIVSDGTVTSQENLMVELYDVNEQHTLVINPTTSTVPASTTGAGVLIATATSTDPDRFNGAFRNHRYWLVDLDPNNELFTLNANNGQVTTARDLRTWRGTPEVYTLSIISSDGMYSDGPENLYISVTDIRQPPRITNLPSSVTVLETDTAVTNIFTLANWNDNGNPVTYEYVTEYPLTWSPIFYVAGTDDEDIWHIGNPGFDYLLVQEYQVEVTVRDGRNWYADYNVNLTVQVEWVNQPPEWVKQPPLFVTPSYASTIFEGEPIGTELPDVLLEATDRDLPVGDWMDYTISGQGSHLFYADNTTNRIYTAADIRIPYNQDQQVFNLKVHVYDSEGENVEADLVVTVQDINDNAPVFDPDTYTGTVTEDSPGETYVMTVFASDLDGPSSDVALYLVIDPTASQYFQIDTAGIMTTKQPIDYSIYQNFTFTIMVLDSGLTPLNGTATVFIEVIEINSHRPDFTPNFYNMEVKSDTNAGEIVLILAADDADTERVNSVTYFFLIPQDDFYIGQKSGELTVARSLSSGNKYLIYPMARDKGVPEYISDPVTVRIDTYKPSSHLVDIHMTMSTGEFKDKENDFLDAMDSHLSPWLPRVESYSADGSGTIVTMYALEDDTAETIDELRHEKKFVHRDDLLSELRTNIPGNPKDELKTGDFLEFGIYEVQPTHPVWIVDTVEGIITLTILCLLVLILIILLLVYLCKRKGWLCFTNNKVEPRPDRLPPIQEDFNLRYKTPVGDKHKGAQHVLVPRSITRDYNHPTDYDKGRQLTPVMIPPSA